MTNTKKRSEAIRLYKDGKLKIREICSQLSLSLSTFWYWLNKENTSKNRSGVGGWRMPEGFGSKVSIRVRGKKHWNWKGDKLLRNCANCGNQFRLTHNRRKNLKRGLVFCSKPCSDKYQTEDRHPSHRGSYGYATAVSIARRSKREWSITISEWKELRKLPCEYCGGPRSENGVGLDRKDNSKGYSIGNVAPCCPTCNYVKRDEFTYEEMVTVLGPAIKSIFDSREQVRR